jgi:NitT/TauT family transport system permease protein
VRKGFLLILLALAWELYTRHLANPLLFPTFSATIEAFTRDIENGVLIDRTLLSLQLLLMGYGAGIALAAILTLVAFSFRLGNDLLETLTGMFNPLPAIALLPLALVWFGIGSASIIFVVVHSVTWAIALNTHSGFRAVSQTLKMVGRNYGLSGIGLVSSILIPAAFANILTGLKIGWAFAWRSLIAAELVFGVSAGEGGLGWYIFQHKNTLDIPEVFAGLFMVILIGLFIENVVFAMIESYTVRRWGMQN